MNDYKLKNVCEKKYKKMYLRYANKIFLQPDGKPKETKFNIRY